MTKAYEISYHRDFGRYMLYIPAGVDPIDGQPLTYATALTPEESALWQCGETEQLERSLRTRGIPLPGPCGIREGKFRRWLKALARKLGGAS